MERRKDSTSFDEFVPPFFFCLLSLIIYHVLLSFSFFNRVRSRVLAGKVESHCKINPIRSIRTDYT